MSCLNQSNLRLFKKEAKDWPYLHMWTMAKIRDGSTYLGQHLCKNDYYSKEEQVMGQWVGSIAQHWDLDGKEIKAGDKLFEGLRQGYTPDGKKLTQRAGSDIKFYDFQVGAAKSVSMMAVMMGDERLRQAHEEAGKKAFNEMEKFASYRDRKGLAAWTEANVVTGQVIAAKFTHDASRGLDPQLHSHYVVSNVTIGSDGQRYALDTKLMCQAIRYAGKVYQSEMALKCQQLGYRIDVTENEKGQIEGFQIRGVSSELLERYSKRREQVEMAIVEFRKEKHREPTRAEITVLTRNSRDRQGLREITTPEVRAQQLAQMSPDERQSLEKLVMEARQKQDTAVPVAPLAVQEALDGAVNHLFERHSTVKEHELFADALNRGLGQRISIDQLDSGKARAQGGILRTGEGQGLQETLTTRENLNHETDSVDRVNRSRGACRGLYKPKEIDGKLSKEQRQAVEFVGTSSDRVMEIRGVAGAGKTTTLSEIDKQLKEAKHKTLYLAPTRSAVDVLKQEGFKNATTVADYLIQHKNGTAPVQWRGAVTVVDEAGLLSARHGHALLEWATRSQGRVLLVGDARQHSSVESGDWLRILERHSKMARCELTDIRRQQVTEYNTAIREMSCGKAAQGLRAARSPGLRKRKQKG